jgi:hypothetical protein
MFAGHGEKLMDSFILSIWLMLVNRSMLQPTRPATISLDTKSTQACAQLASKSMLKPYNDDEWNYVCRRVMDSQNGV